MTNFHTIHSFAWGISRFLGQLSAILKMFFSAEYYFVLTKSLSALLEVRSAIRRFSNVMITNHPRWTGELKAAHFVLESGSQNMFEFTSRNSLQCRVGQCLRYSVELHIN